MLIVEDSADDADLLARELQRGGYGLVCERVETAEAMKAALAQQAWDLVVSYHSVLQFDSLAALNVLKASGADIPSIIVSGTIGEELAVQAMKAQERLARRVAQQTLRDSEQQAVLELAARHPHRFDGCWRHSAHLMKTDHTWR